MEGCLSVLCMVVGWVVAILRGQSIPYLEPKVSSQPLESSVVFSDLQTGFLQSPHLHHMICLLRRTRIGLTVLYDLAENPQAKGFRLRQFHTG